MTNDELIHYLSTGTLLRIVFDLGAAAFVSTANKQHIDGLTEFVVAIDMAITNRGIQAAIDARGNPQ